MAPDTPPLSPRYPPIPSSDPAWSPDPARRDHNPFNPTDDVEDLARAANAPADFFCPISLELMRDPVTIPSTGQTFERRAIESWLSRGGRLCPTTGLPLDPAETFVPNDTLRAAVLAWALDRCPAVVDPDTAAIRESPESRDARVALERAAERAQADAAAKRQRDLAIDRSLCAYPTPTVEGNPGFRGGAEGRRTSGNFFGGDGEGEGEGDVDVRVFIPANRAGLRTTTTNARTTASGLVPVRERDRSPRYFLPWAFVAFAVVAFAYNLARVNDVTFAPFRENPLLGGAKRSMIGDDDAVDPLERRPPYAHCGALWRIDRGGGGAMVLTSPFAHGSLVNLAATAWAVLAVGPSACGDAGEFAFAATYLLSAFAGVAASMFAFADRVTCAGHAGIAGILGLLLARNLVISRGGGGGEGDPSGTRPGTIFSAVVAIVFASFAPYHDLVAPFAAALVGFFLAFLFYKPEFGASLGWSYRAETRAHVAARVLLLVAFALPFALVAGLKNGDALAAATRRSDALEMMRCVPGVRPWSCDVDLLCGGVGGVADDVACGGEANEGGGEANEGGSEGNDQVDDGDGGDGSDDRWDGSTSYPAPPPPPPPPPRRRGGTRTYGDDDDDHHHPEEDSR